MKFVLVVRITRSFVLSYMNLQPDSGCKWCTCKLHLSVVWTLLIMSSSMSLSSWPLNLFSTLSELKTNCDENLLILCPKGVIRLLMSVVSFDDKRLSFDLGVDTELYASTCSFLYWLFGVLRIPSSPKSLLRIIIQDQDYYLEACTRKFDLHTVTHTHISMSSLE